MNKIKLLVISVIVLVVLNLFLVSNLFFKTKPPFPLKGRKLPREIIIEKLNFDENQIVDYVELIKEHRREIRTNDREIRQLKKKLYSLLQSDNFELKDSLITKINIIQEDIEYIHFDHFMDIKNICNDNQLEEFNKLSVELSKLFSPHKPPRRKP